MKKRGFTLVELLGIIVIISIILYVSIPPIIRNVANSKTKLYQAQIENVKLALENWTIDNKDSLPTSENESISITVAQLKQEGYLDIDAGTKKDVCVPNDTTLTITKIGDSYKYEVNEGTGTLSCNDEVDLGAPKIYLIGSAIEYVEINSDWVDKGAIAKTSDGVDITTRITKITKGDGNSVDTSVEGNKYEITYSITDNGYTSEVKRIVYIRDTTPPVLTIPDDITITTENTTFNLMAGVTATDNSRVEPIITVIGSITLGQEGTYEITYRACDKAKPEPNCTEKKRRIKIIDTTKPDSDAYVIGNPFNENGWANQDFEIHVGTSDEGGSSVAGYRYCLSTYTACEPNIEVGDKRGNITVSTESKENIFCYYSYDYSGNQSDKKCIGPYALDKTNPIVKVNVNGTKGKNNWYTSNVVVSIETDDPKDMENKNLSGVWKYGIRPNNGNQTGTNTSDLQIDYNMKTSITQEVDTNGITYWGYVIDKAGNQSNASSWFKQDKTPPVCTVAKTGTIGENNWYIDNVTINMSRSDNLSGVVAFGMKPNNGNQNENINSDTVKKYNSVYSIVQKEDTSGITYRGWIEDEAGNTNNCETSLKKDATKPTCTLSQTGIKGKNNWYTGDVTVAIKSDDNLSGVAGREILKSASTTYNGTYLKTTDYSVNHSSETRGVTYTGYIKDEAGNKNTCQTSFKQDLNNPTCTVKVTNATSGQTASGSDLWYRGTAIMKYSSSDSLSGVKYKAFGKTNMTSSTQESITEEITRSGDTPKTGETYYGYVEDEAGRTTQCQKTLYLDNTNPSCTLSDSGTMGKNSWYTSDVTVSISSSDALSDIGGVDIKKSTSTTHGVDSYTETSDYSVSHSAENSSITYTGYVRDKAGNQSTCSTTFKQDLNNPTCTISQSGGTEGDESWYRGTLTISYSASDTTNGSGVKYRDFDTSSISSSTSTSASNTYSISGNTTTSGKTYYGYVEDESGRKNTCRKTFKVDNDNPTCTSSGGSSTWINKNSSTTSRTITGTCDDGLSGCKSAYTSGKSYTYSSDIDTTSAGPNNGGSWKVYDKAGNSATCPANQTVKIDKTPPTCDSVKITSGTKGKNNNNWYVSQVTITGYCSDDTSGCATSNITQTFTKDQDRGYHGFDSSKVIKDNAGNTNTCGTVYFGQDTQPPYAPVFTMSSRSGVVSYTLEAAHNGSNGRAKCGTYNSNKEIYCQYQVVCSKTNSDCGLDVVRSSITLEDPKKDNVSSGLQKQASSYSCSPPYNPSNTTPYEYNCTGNGERFWHTYKSCSEGSGCMKIDNSGESPAYVGQTRLTHAMWAQDVAGNESPGGTIDYWMQYE